MLGSTIQECLWVRQHDVGGLGMYVIFQLEFMSAPNGAAQEFYQTPRYVEVIVVAV